MTTLLQIIGGAGAPLIGVAFLYRRFRRAATSEIEPFRAYLTQGIKYYLGRYVRRRLAAEFTVRQYARVQLRSTAVEMVVPATYPVPLKVDDVFVPLLLRGPTQETTEYRTLLDTATARVVIVGDPGSGKSSLMKRLFRDACRRAHVDPGGSPLPVLFELRNLAQLAVARRQQLSYQQLFDLCLTGLRSTAAFKSNTAVDDLHHGPGFLVLLDGLDEVPSDAASAAIAAITALSSHLSLASPRSSLLVSTRTQHYVALHDRGFAEAFKVLAIRPFSMGDIYKFLLRWPFDEGRSENVTRLFSRIRQLPSLAEMCTNPLALAMFVARDQQTGGALTPDTRSEFYSSLVDELLVNRRLRREEGAIGRQRLREQRESILGAVCLDHLLEAEEAPNSVPHQRLRDATERAGYSSDEVVNVITGLAVDTGLFSTEREGESYRFLHLTLCEFLAAREVVNEGSAGWARIAERVFDSSDDGEIDWSARLAEVIAFACGLAPRALRAEMLRSLVESDDAVLLLRAAIEAQNYDDDRVRRAVVALVARLAGVGPGRWDVAWFAELRWLLAVLRDIAESTSARPELPNASALPTAAEFLLDLIDRHGAQDTLLANLARQDAASAVAIAEASSRPELLMVVASAADDFSVLLAILARCEKNGLAWKNALVHTALRQTQIAEALVSTSADGAQATGKWQRFYMTEGSIYGQLLDDVLEHPESWIDDDAGTLRRLARVNPPRSVLLAAARMLLPLILPLLIVFSLLLLPPSWNAEEGALVWVVATVLLGSFSSAFVVLSAPTLRPSDTIRLRVLGLFAVEFKLKWPRESARVESTEKYARLSRIDVLTEAVNLRRYRFGRGDTRLERPEPWRPSAVVRLLSGVKAEDIEVLVASRRLRQSAGATTE